MEVDQFIERCSELSLTARAAIALLVLEKYCKAHAVDSPEVDDLLAHLWQWPRVEFAEWERNRPVLVDVGLGDPLPAALDRRLRDCGVGAHGFTNMIAGLVGILWGNFWGGADDGVSLEALRSVVAHARISDFPPLTPFRFSRFADAGGWGVELTAEDHEYWQSLRSGHPGRV